ncbi:MAG: hypothetical protein IK066_10880 [Kiritimatiellae bacterium]|nr:hypothetical protein [Kiritimatiellia bacterium]
MRFRTAIFALAAALWGASAARGVTVTGADWRVHYNLPDQKSGANTATPDKFAIRDAWLQRIDALKKGDWACLSTYTFSGNSEASGAAGPILKAVNGALDRGATVGFVVGSGVNTASNFWPGMSLASLSKKGLKLSKAPSGGIMHHKMGVFSYKATGETWVLAGSWNFTGGASINQWNAMVEIRNKDLAAACSNELSQLLAGKFHADAAKVHYEGAFKVDGGPCRVRFSPQPDGKYGGDNVLRDITNAIAAAKSEIFFGLNKLTRGDVVDQLIAACDRGVVVHGAVPLSDCADSNRDSWEMVQRLCNPAEYKTANRVRMYLAWREADRESLDSRQTDLIHAKYMVIDPWGDSPMVIQGSANWTAAGLVLTSSNDEDVQFLGVPGIARAFAEQFGRMTEGLQPVVTKMERKKDGGWTLGYWHPPGSGWWVETSGTLGEGAAWKKAADVPAARTGEVGGGGGGRGFFRVAGGE